MKIDRLSRNINCIVCDKSLEDQSNDDRELQPYNGLEFFTYGHYGSTVFDPVGVRQRICVAICDECVQKGIKDGKVLGDIEDIPLEPYKFPESDPENGIF